MEPIPCRAGDGEEYVLDFVLERKGSQDLLSSIKDGRYVSQKWRMLACGLATRLYLSETEGDHVLGEGSKRVLRTARASTQIIDGFTLLHSRGGAAPAGARAAGPGRGQGGRTRQHMHCLHPPVVCCLAFVMLQPIIRACAHRPQPAGFSSAHLRPNTVDWLANLTGSIARRYEHAGEQYLGSASCRVLLRVTVAMGLCVAYPR